MVYQFHAIVLCHLLGKLSNIRSIKPIQKAISILKMNHLSSLNNQAKVPHSIFLLYLNSTQPGVVLKRLYLQSWIVRQHFKMFPPLNLNLFFEWVYFVQYENVLSYSVPNRWTETCYFYQFKRIQPFKYGWSETGPDAKFQVLSYFNWNGNLLFVLF